MSIKSIGEKLQENETLKAFMVACISLSDEQRKQVLECIKESKLN